MPKKKKTRKQKILSDLRQQQAIVPSTHISFEDKPSEHVTHVQHVPSTPSRISISTSSYAYLSHDLWKTFFLTIIIVIVELALHYFIIK